MKTIRQRGFHAERKKKFIPCLFLCISISFFALGIGPINASPNLDFSRTVNFPLRKSSFDSPAVYGSWTPLGRGTIAKSSVNSVRAISVNGSDVYVGGVINGATNTDGTDVLSGGIAKWNGSTWSSLGMGTSNVVHAIEVVGSNVYVGGYFSLVYDNGSTFYLANNIARWDGTNWHTLGTGVSGNGTVYRLKLVGDNLYVAGSFKRADPSGANLKVNNIAVWNTITESWSTIGQGLNGQVNDFVIDGSDIYVTGSFTKATNTDNSKVDTRYIAKWNGSQWSALGDGLGGIGSSIEIFNGSVFVSGGFSQVNYGPDYVDANHIARWDGSNWFPVGLGLNGDVKQFVVNNGKLYMGGDFTQATNADSTTVIVNHLTFWDGSEWGNFINGVNGIVYALAPGSLYVGGNFTDAGGVDYADIVARFDPDTLPPFVTTSSPANGATIQPTNTLLVTFNEDMKNDGSTGAANYTGNYRLIEAKGDGFQADGCTADVGDQDLDISINSAVYDNHGGSGPFEVTLGINGGIPLPNGNYRLMVCGTTSVEDLSGNKINGGEGDTFINFIVLGQAKDDDTSLKVDLPQTGFAPRQLTNLPAQPEERLYSNLGSLWMEIPKFGIQASIVGVPVSKDGWDLTWLGSNVGWLNGTAFPTWAGNSGLTAHVVDANGQPGLFAHLQDLSWGDQIFVNAWGQKYIYEVRDIKKDVEPDDTSALAHEDYPWLTLITCRGFDSEKDRYRWRVVVKAVQVSIK